MSQGILFSFLASLVPRTMPFVMRVASSRETWQFLLRPKVSETQQVRDQPPFLSCVHHLEVESSRASWVWVCLLSKHERKSLILLGSPLVLCFCTDVVVECCVGFAAIVAYVPPALYTDRAVCMASSQSALEASPHTPHTCTDRRVQGSYSTTGSKTSCALSRV